MKIRQSFDTSVASFMLEGAKEDLADDASPLLTIYTTDPETNLVVPGGVDTELRDCESRLALYAEGLRTSTFCKVVTIRKHSSTRHGNHGVGPLHLPLFW